MQNIVGAPRIACDGRTRREVLRVGGVRAGMAYSASDAQGAYPRDLPVSPGDIVATVYRLVGIDPETTVNDLTGRPVPISHGGRPIEGILACAAG
jgi:hypothetical protein